MTKKQHKEKRYIRFFEDVRVSCTPDSNVIGWEIVARERMRNKLMESPIEKAKKIGIYENVKQMIEESCAINAKKITSLLKVVYNEVRDDYAKNVVIEIGEKIIFTYKFTATVRFDIAEKIAGYTVQSIVDQYERSVGGENASYHYRSALMHRKCGLQEKVMKVRNAFEFGKKNGYITGSQRDLKTT